MPHAPRVTSLHAISKSPLLPRRPHPQFTISVANADPKKSKYSDTLHRFCKKEHDWGWKKFMELSKVGAAPTGALPPCLRSTHAEAPAFCSVALSSAVHALVHAMPCRSWTASPWPTLW